MTTAFKKNTNNAAGQLASVIDDNDLSFSLGTGEGAEFPSSGAFWVTFYDTEPEDGEIVLCDSRSSDTFTINASGRGAQGTSATSWAVGTNVALLFTAGAVDEIQAAINAIENGSKTLTSVTASGAMTAASAAIGGGYGSSGVSISSAGNIDANGTIVADGAISGASVTVTGAAAAASAAIGGGYGSSGVSISSAGNIQANGNMTVDGLLSLTRSPSPATISAGTLTVANSYTRVETEGAAATDDVDNIAGLTEPSIVIFRSTSYTRDPTFRHNAGGTGNLRMIGGTNKTLVNTSGRIAFFFDPDLGFAIELLTVTI